MSRFDPFLPTATQTREAVLVFLVTKDFRTMTGSLRRVDDRRWEAVYLLDGELYQTTLGRSRRAAEAFLVRQRDALEAAGWTPHAVKDTTSDP